jgi:hypothetical protein
VQNSGKPLRAFQKRHHMRPPVTVARRSHDVHDKAALGLRGSACQNDVRLGREGFANHPAQLLLDPALQPDQRQRERNGVEPAQLSPASTFRDRPACAARVGRQLVDVADHAATDG